MFQQEAAASRLATEYQTVKDDSHVKKKRNRVNTDTRLKDTDAAARSIIAQIAITRAANLKRLKEARLKHESKTPPADLGEK